MTSICYLLMFSVYVEVVIVVIQSSPKFGEHPYDHYFEFFIG